MWARRIKPLDCTSSLLVFLGFLFMLWDAHEHCGRGSGTIIAEGSNWFLSFYLRNEIPLVI